MERERKLVTIAEYCAITGEDEATVREVTCAGLSDPADISLHLGTILDEMVNPGPEDERE